MTSKGEEPGRLAETLDRAHAYLAAGADGVFVPGLLDLAVISELTSRIPAPVNILAGPGAPLVVDLAKLGIARVSLGSSVAEAAYAVVQRAARELAEEGTYTALAGALDYGEVNALTR